MSERPTPPNFIIFMSDQQRRIQDFPSDWVKKHLPNLSEFMNNGAVFENHICNTSPCGPSRASLFSGMFPANNGVTGNQGTITPEQMNFATILNAQGYDVHYMGKLHMVDELTTFSTGWKELSPDDAAATALDENALLANSYGIQSWTSPDFGTMLVQGQDLSADSLANLAGGSGNNDDRVVTGKGSFEGEASVQEVLKRLQSDEQKKSFCLVISLLNPHDISLYPYGWAEAGYANVNFSDEQFKDFQLPHSYNDPLDHKPTVQAAYLNTACKGKLTNDKDLNALNYLKFYAYLHTLSDQLFGKIYDLITPETKENTMLIRMADHGEMGMAHGGLQEKNFSMYKEMINVPMIWQHSGIKAGSRTQMVSLIDFVPTLASLAGAKLADYPQLQGSDYSSALWDAKAKFHESSLFNYPTSGAAPPPPSLPVNASNYFELNPNATESPASYPGNIYAIVTNTTKFAIYYSVDSFGMVQWSKAQFEMYDLEHDVDEMHNKIPPLADGEHYLRDYVKLIVDGYTALTGLMHEKKIDMPQGWELFWLTYSLS